MGKYLSFFRVSVIAFPVTSCDVVSGLCRDLCVRVRAEKGEMAFAQYAHAECKCAREVVPSIYHTILGKSLSAFRVSVVRFS